MIRLLLFCLALGMAIYGTLMGSATSLLLAALFMAVVSGSWRWRNGWQSIGERHGWLLLVLGAIGAAVAAAYQSRRDPFDLSSSYYWFVGLTLILIATYLRDQIATRARTPMQPTAADTAQPAPLPTGLHFTRLDWLLMLGVTAAALALRLYRLSDYLPTMHGDEGEMGEMAMWALHGADQRHITPLAVFATGFLDHPNLFHYLQALALYCFGENLTSLRILSASFGALCAGTLYALGRVGWGRVAGVAAAWLLAVSHLHIHYSRIALNNIQSAWFTIAFFLVLLIGVHRSADRREHNPSASIQPLLPYAILGLVIGLSQYFYYGSRLIPVLAVVLLGLLLLQRRLTWAQLTIAVLATLIAYAPLGWFYSQNLRSFLNRTQGVSVFNPDGLLHTLGPDASWPRDVPLLFWSQLKRNLAFMINYGDMSAFYLADLPGFDRVTVTLFWLGLGVVLAKFRRFQETALLAWFGLGIILAGVVTNDSPNGPRLIVVVTSVYLIAGIMVQRLHQAVVRLWPFASQRLTGVALVVLMLGTLPLNYQTYFVQYARFAPNYMPITMAHLMRDHQADYRFYLFGAPNFFVEYSVLRFVAPDSERYNVMTAGEIPAPTMPLDKGIMAIALIHRIDELNQVEARWPGGEWQEYYDQIGRLLFVTYRWPRTMVLSQQQVAAPTADTPAIPPPFSPVATEQATP